MKINFENDDCHIKLAHDSNMIIPVVPENANSVMLVGNWENVFGEWQEVMPFGMPTFVDNLLGNILPFLRRGGNLVVMCDEITKEYFKSIFGKLEKCCGGLDIPKPLLFIDIDKMYNDNEELDFSILKEKNMKFDMIIQNPPYKGPLHLEFLEKGLNLLKETGKMVIVEPATWLIDIRKNGKYYTKFSSIKNKIEGHVESVAIENLNAEFNISEYHPLSITTIDFSKNYNFIKFTCCGEEKYVKSIYDCNLIGNYNLIWNIFNKILKYEDTMKNHVFVKSNNINTCSKYLRYWNYSMYGLGSNYGGVVNQYRSNSDAVMRTVSNGRYFMSYVVSGADGDICDTVVVGAKGNICDCVYGTKEELENWKHFVFNNKLPLFLNIILTIDQNNNSKEFVPWLVDRQYTDDEINKLFGFTEEEIRLMDMTLKKYERNSPWFRRYMCGKDSATDDEVNEFIKRISE